MPQALHDVLIEIYPDGMLAGGYDSPVVDTGAYSYPRVCYLGYKIYPRVIHRAILDTGLSYSPMYTLCNAMDLPAADTKEKKSHSSNQKTVSRTCTASENDAVQPKTKSHSSSHLHCFRG